MFRFIKRITEKRKKEKAEINELMESIMHTLNNTREDNIDLFIPTKYYVEINNRLIDEHNLNLDYIRGNDNICEVNVCEYVNKHEIGEKVK